MSDSKKNTMFPMNLQLFGEGAESNTGNNTGTSGDTAVEIGAENQTPSVDELLAQLAQERAEKAQNKAALDKALKEKGDITKQLRAKQTAEEAEAETKAQIDEQQKAYVKGLEDKLAIIAATDRYRNLGMEAAFAAETAKYEVEGNMEKVTANISKQMKLNQDAAYAEFIKNRPDVQAGNADDGKKTKAAELAAQAAKRNSAASNNDILSHYIPGGNK